MKVSKIMSLVLGITIVLSTINVFAVREGKDDNSLFSTDFNSDLVDGNPKNIYTNTKTTEIDNAYIKVHAPDDLNSTNYLAMTDTKDSRMRTDFKGVSSGKIYYEFDAKFDNAGLQLSIVNSAAPTTVGSNWVFSVHNDNTMWAYPTGSSAPQSSETGTKITLKNTTEDMCFVKNAWQHYKFVIDIDSSSVTVFLDGQESNVITGFSYINNSYPISGIGFRKSAASDSSIYIDNINAYTEPVFKTEIINDTADTFSTAIPGENGYSGYQSWKITGLEHTSIVKKSQSRSYYATGEKEESNIATSEIDDPDNNVIKLTNGTACGYNIKNYSGGTIITEFDFQAGNGGFAFGFMDAASGKRNYRMPFIYYRNDCVMAMTDQSLIDATSEPLKANLENYLVSKTTTKLSPVPYQWNHARVELSLVTGDCVLTITDNASNVKTSNSINIPYFKDMTVSQLFFRHYIRTTTVNDQDVFMDNVKVTVTSDGDSIQSVNTGSNKFKLNFKDNIDMTTLTAADVIVKNTLGDTLAVKSVKAGSNHDVLVEMQDTLTENDVYDVNLPSTVKYTDGYNILETSQQFTYTNGAFTASASFSEDTELVKGSTVTANYILNPTDLSDKAVKLIVAAYDSDGVVDVKEKDINISDTTYGVINDSISFTLNNDASKISAFIWNDELVPYTESVTITE